MRMFNGKVDSALSGHGFHEPVADLFGRMRHPAPGGVERGLHLDEQE